MKDNSIKTADGSTIAYYTIGKGPSIIIVPGVLSMAKDYSTFANALSETFTVHTIERRGRGKSSAQDDTYSLATERADVLALQKRTQASYLFGHSYGGLIALETARNNPSLKKVMVYEPGVSINGCISVEWASNYENQLAQNKPLDAFVDFSIAMGPGAARNTPRWLMKLLLPVIMKSPDLQQKLDLLATNLREHREIAHLDNTYKNYKDISAETLLMYGGKSGLEWVGRAIKQLSEVIPVSQTRKFHQLNHFGPDQTGPREVAEAIREYVLD
jgi:pimeloyl-ACP methyl ester carboxylesterase